MYYLLTGRVDWADEFDVDFFEVVSQEDGEKYKIAQEIFKSYPDNYCFGTNEYWDDFDYLGFDLKPITDEDYEALKRMGLVDSNGWTTIGREIVTPLIENLEDARDGQGLELINLFECSVEEFRKACEELSDCYA